MILLLVAVALKSTAQELNCKFTVNYSQIQGTSTQVFTTLENALMEFINTRRWTQAWRRLYRTFFETASGRAGEKSGPDTKKSAGS